LRALVWSLGKSEDEGMTNAMKTFPARVGAAVAVTALGLTLTAGAGAPAAAADSFNQKITCKKADVRTKPQGKGKHVMFAYQKSGDWGHITRSWLNDQDIITYWYGTWHHNSKSARGWVKIACADPRA
jgi:hypothetical protein